MKVLLIIPAYNEADNIEKVVNHIIENYPQYDYVIINDGSKDNTEEICMKNHYNLISLPLNLGIGGAVQTGYQYALKNHYDILRLLPYSKRLKYERWKLIGAFLLSNK